MPTADKQEPQYQNISIKQKKVSKCLTKCVDILTRPHTNLVMYRRTGLDESRQLRANGWMKGLNIVSLQPTKANVSSFKQPKKGTISCKKLYLHVINLCRWTQYLTSGAPTFWGYYLSVREWSQQLFKTDCDYALIGAARSASGLIMWSNPISRWHLPIPNGNHSVLFGTDHLGHHHSFLSNTDRHSRA